MTQTGLYHQTEKEIDTELELVKAAQADPRRFESLYTKYYKRIAGYIFHRINDEDLAFEITAEVFYRALDNLSRFRAQGVPFSAWLFRIAANELNQWYRKQKAERTISIDAEGWLELKADIEDESRAAEEERLFAALQLLEPDEMELIDMRFFEKRPFKEICAITGLGESACKMRLYRTLEKLKTNLKARN